MLANVTQAEIAAKGPRKVTNMVEPFCTLIHVEANPLRAIVNIVAASIFWLGWPGNHQKRRLLELAVSP